MSKNKKRPTRRAKTRARKAPHFVSDTDFTGGSTHDMPRRDEHLEANEQSFENRIQKLVEDWNCNGNEDFIAELITTALKIGHDCTDQLDLKIMNRALKEMRYANVIFHPYRSIRKVTVFGSARTNPGDPAYDAAVEFSRRMVDANFMTITGAGPGIMAAGNEGAGTENSFGLRIQLPFEAGANEYIDRDHKLINFRYFFTRKLSFVKEAHAVALFPGGFGTMDEAFEVMTLIQTGKAIMIPLVMIEPPGGTYWKTFQDFIEGHLLGRGMISEEDLSLFRITHSVDEAIEEIVSFYRVFHSYRYVKDKLVIRLNHEIAPAGLEHLNDEFGGLLEKGRFEIAPALPEEADQEEILDLPRLVGITKRAGYGRFRQFLDVLNQLEPAVEAAA